MIGLIAIISGSVNAQNKADLAIESITAAELRGHIYFLVSDYLKGRVATAPEYEIAAQYVAAQFAAGGLEPGIMNDEGSFNEI